MRTPAHRWTLLALVATSGGWLMTGCVAPLGPGYTIERQQIDIQFAPGPPPRIRILADYSLRNSGNRPLYLFEMRLPAGRRVSPEDLRLEWDGAEIAPKAAEWNARNSVITLPSPWTRGERHALRISYELRQPAAGDAGLNFAEDAFFLPASAWAPEFPQERGLFGFGGVPPVKWDLVVRVPQNFTVHTSGGPGNLMRAAGEQVVRSLQTAADHYPFVIAGRYTSSEIGSSKQGVHVWMREKQEPQILQQASERITTITRSYDVVFGARAKSQTDLWIVECPVLTGCFSNFNPVTATLLGDEGGSGETAEMASSDTLLVNIHSGAERLAATAGPGLAASWLGYGQNPGFYEQTPPLSQLPTFAAAVGREALQGPQYRAAAIRRALTLVPKGGPPAAVGSRKPQPESDTVIRAKSFLFFYGLQDRFGGDSFRRAISEMLSARRGHGFDISDLIAAFDDETHQNAAEFVRLWMKHPGVPDDFRARYESPAAGTSGAGHTAAQQR